MQGIGDVVLNHMRMIMRPASGACQRPGDNRARQSSRTRLYMEGTTLRDIAMRSFKSLSEQEILALAISLEEEDARIYDDFADGLKDDYPAQAEQFRKMRGEEDGHRHRLIELYRQKFGEHIPLIRRQDVKGFVSASRSGWCGRWVWTPCASRPS